MGGAWRKKVARNQLKLCKFTPVKENVRIFNIDISILTRDWSCPADFGKTNDLCGQKKRARLD